MKKFDYSLDYKALDLRKHPELYAIGKGEQGVLSVEPYKSEILPYWKFKNQEVARESSEKIYGLFEEYLDKDDFVGADMARKFLQMGFTRAMRYANHPSGKKYKGPVPADKKGQSGAHGRDELERGPRDLEKEAAAEIFKKKWDAARNHAAYKLQKEAFVKKFE